jgi:hypothetical protein
VESSASSDGDELFPDNEDASTDDEDASSDDELLADALSDNEGLLPDDERLPFDELPEDEDDEDTVPMSRAYEVRKTIKITASWFFSTWVRSDDVLRDIEAICSVLSMQNPRTEAFVVHLRTYIRGERTWSLAFPQSSQIEIRGLSVNCESRKIKLNIWGFKD